jgi:hypothetical protein
MQKYEKLEKIGEGIKEIFPRFGRYFVLIKN